MPNGKDLFNKAKQNGTTGSLGKDAASGKEIPSTLKDYAAEQVADAEGFKAAPAEPSKKEINLDDLNETTLLKYPIIAKALNEAPMAIIKPKDSSVAFHWVFYDRSASGSTARVVAANVQRYKFWGFEFATLEDIAGGEEALGDGMIDDGGQITNYDTVLMKINKVRLMSHYKKNLLDSLMMVDEGLAHAIKAAEADIVQSGTYGKAMSSHPKAKIEFYSPLES